MGLARLVALAGLARLAGLIELAATFEIVGLSRFQEMLRFIVGNGWVGGLTFFSPKNHNVQRDARLYSRHPLRMLHRG